MKKLALLTVIFGLFSGPAFAQVSVDLSDRPIKATPTQERCITTMAEFPDDGHVARYQFFRLTQELASGSTSEFRAAMDQFGDGSIEADTPILDVIEAIANPVLRQAAPELAVAHMDHLIDFANACDTYLTGQIESLRAYDTALSLEDPIINEDALFLRQVLSDSLFRLGAEKDLVHGASVQNYAASLIVTRDDIEFTNFEVEIHDLEALYMTDLDGRLARSNDLINSEIDRGTLEGSISLSDSMNESAKNKNKQNALRTLLRILQRR